MPDAHLELMSAPGYDVQIVSENPTAADVRTTLHMQPWTDITFVTLRRDDANWMVISGSLNPEDGLSATVCEDGVQMISARAPRSLKQCMALMTHYLGGRDAWRSLIRWTPHG